MHDNKQEHGETQPNNNASRNHTFPSSEEIARFHSQKEIRLPTTTDTEEEQKPRRKRGRALKTPERDKSNLNLPLRCPRQCKVDIC
ncbi:hypothetical protein AVEN_234064-1 [Araneus ventricosus]|uniref:Uncharacterized protein n=1 Tax=Araneus ventricosus TaxID=182803 RepID=A0A4Y2LRJ3_ARAVE|nr:hypothetical protein AVEN_89882-1 [Araneus ventricosus]GBN15995.1 hypothetical protein AVEN_234064-1 [Araneus ventricosus]